MVNVAVVVNRNARHLAEDEPLRRALLARARAMGAHVHETSTITDLQAAARDLAARGVTAVVLAGGDGSHGAGVTALWKVYGASLPPVVLAPGGTVGIVARNLYGGRRNKLDALLSAAADADAVSSAQPVPTLRIVDDAGVDRLAFIFGTGLVARFFESYDAEPHRGITVAARLAGRAFLGSVVGTSFAKQMLTPVGCRLEVDGETRPGAAFSLVLASVVPQVGLGIRATYRAAERTDRFHVVASTRSPRGLATQVPAVLSGRAMKGEDAVDLLAAELRVVFDSTDAYVVDGDSHRARVVSVTPGPVVRVVGASTRSR